MKAKLCKCNNCDTIMIDQNPKGDTPELEVPDNATEMQFMDEKEGGFWACPVCEVDGYLMDITEEIHVSAAPSTPVNESLGDVFEKMDSHVNEFNEYLNTVVPPVNEVKDKMQDALLWFKNMDNSTAEKICPKYSYLIGKDRLLTDDIKLKIYLLEFEQKDKQEQTQQREGFTGGKWQSIFNSDKNMFEIHSSGRIIGYLPNCMDGEFGKYETSENIKILLSAPTLYRYNKKLKECVRHLLGLITIDGYEAWSKLEEGLDERDMAQIQKGIDKANKLLSNINQ